MDKELMHVLDQAQPIGILAIAVVMLAQVILGVSRSKNGSAPATRDDVARVHSITEKLLDHMQNHAQAEERVLNELVGTLKGIQDQLRLQGNKQESIFRDLIELRADLRAQERS